MYSRLVLLCVQPQGCGHYICCIAIQKRSSTTETCRRTEKMSEHKTGFLKEKTDSLSSSKSYENASNTLNGRGADRCALPTSYMGECAVRRHVNTCVWSSCTFTFRVFPLDGRNRIAFSRAVQYHCLSIDAVLVLWLHHKFGRNCKSRTNYITHSHLKMQYKSTDDEQLTFTAQKM